MKYVGQFYILSILLWNFILYPNELYTFLNFGMNVAFLGTGEQSHFSLGRRFILESHGTQVRRGIYE